MIGAMFETNVKYQRLQEILGDTLSNIKYSSNVNVIVDLKSVFRKAYRMKELEVPEMNAIEDISSDVINLIGFYRNFLFGNGKTSTFYLLYSKSECEAMKAIYPNYKSAYYAKYFHSTDLSTMNKIIEMTSKRISSVVKYVPNAYFFDTSSLDELVYCDWITTSKSNQNELSIILSDDAVLYQCLGSHVVALDIKGIATQMISQANVMKYLSEKETTLSGALLPLLLSITGTDRYSIDGVPKYGYKKALKVLNDLVSAGILLDTRYLTFPEELAQTSDLNIKNSISTIKANYQTILPLELKVRNAVVIQSEVSTYVKPIVTKNEFQELNSTIYCLFPINISSLLKGEDVK
jgi:hypothetical protein